MLASCSSLDLISSACNSPPDACAYRPHDITPRLIDELRNYVVPCDAKLVHRLAQSQFVSIKQALGSDPDGGGSLGAQPTRYLWEGTQGRYQWEVPMGGTYGRYPGEGLVHSNGPSTVQEVTLL